MVPIGPPVSTYLIQPDSWVQCLHVSVIVARLLTYVIVIGYRGHMKTLERPCNTCGTMYTPNRSDSKYCQPYCKLKAFRDRHGLRQARVDRELRSDLGGVSSGRLSGAAAKARLALYLLDGFKVDKDIRKIIESM